MQIILKKRYPQMLYWMAMPFFAPMPWEALRFYQQSAAAHQNITLDRFPLGTGAYTLSENNPNYRMVLTKNVNYHAEFYPKEGDFEDKKTLLKDAGKKLPFIDKAVYTLEKEYIPSWNKFIQGFYDVSGISTEVFDSAVQFRANSPDVTEELSKKNIYLISAVLPSIHYFAFNMLDPVVGGNSEQKRKLRQAISIAMDIEEFIQLFLNDAGLAAQGPIPPGIFGYTEGKKGLNTYVYDWQKKPVRKSIQYAKRLLSEAGYPNGIQPNGKPLVLFFDNHDSDSGAKSKHDWLKKQFAKLNIQLQPRTTDYNQFQKKVMQGNVQIFDWGWNADYPDPENFLFLLYGPNSKSVGSGENAANYQSNEFDALYTQIANVTNSEHRLEIIQQMLSILQKDSPWIWGFFPTDYALIHSWYSNVKTMSIGGNTLKYKRIDISKRNEMRKQWNKPVLWPMAFFLFFTGLGIYFFIRTIQKRNKGF